MIEINKKWADWDSHLCTFGLEHLLPANWLTRKKQKILGATNLLGYTYAIAKNRLWISGMVFNKNEWVEWDMLKKATWINYCRICGRFSVFIRFFGENLRIFSNPEIFVRLSGRFFHGFFKKSTKKNYRWKWYKKFHH